MEKSSLRGINREGLNPSLYERVNELKTKIYAAYGSNMNIEQMAIRCPKAKVIGTGILKDYKLTFRGLGRGGVANVEQSKGSSVPIVLWEITSECEVALDRYEGYPSLYTKRVVEVTCKDKSKVKAMGYVMAKRYESYPSEPCEAYYHVIVDGYKANGLSTQKLSEALISTRDEIYIKQNALEK